jgi:hypothetical protein
MKELGTEVHKRYTDHHPSARSLAAPDVELQRHRGPERQPHRPLQPTQSSAQGQLYTAQQERVIRAGAPKVVAHSHRGRE